MSLVLLRDILDNVSRTDGEEDVHDRNVDEVLLVGKIVYSIAFDKLTMRVQYMDAPACERMATAPNLSEWNADG